MRKMLFVAFFAGSMIAGAAQGAGAQSAADWRHGTTLGVFGGAASPQSGTGAVAGASLGWELAPHFTLEGRGLWLGAGKESGEFAGVFGARVPLRPARAIVPFASAGAGVYRATVDMKTSVPAFYQRRMGLPNGFGRRTFDDFVVAVGGGFDVILARHLALRPEATVLMVTTRSDIRTVPVYGVHLAYHFESHPITPARMPGGR